MTGDIETGRYRTVDVCAPDTGYPYPPHAQAPGLVAEFVTWLGSSQAKALHPVEYAALAHYRFITIHPFQDGNTSIAQLLMNLLLLQAGYPITVLKNERRAEYMASLVEAQAGDKSARRLVLLMAAACRESFADCFGLLATAGQSRGCGAAFYSGS